MVTVALIVASLLLPGSVPPEIPADAARALMAVPLPSVDEIEPAVAEALGDTAGVLVRTLAEPEAPPAALAAAYGQLGLVAHAHQFLDTARSSYLNALVLFPDQPLWTYALGLVEEARGDLEAAIGRYRAVLVRHAADGPARFRLGSVLLDLGRLDEAEAEAHRALESPAVRTATLAALGQVAMERQDWARAVERFEAVLTVEPRANRLHYPLGLAYRGLGDAAQAEHHLARRGEAGVAPGDALATQLQELAAGERISLLRGRLAFQAGDFRGAIAEFERALVAAPQSAAARIGLAAALAGAGQRDAAVRELEQVVASDPEQATARFNLAALAMSSGDLERAEEHFGRYLERFPIDREALLALGDVLRRRGSLDRALEFYSRAEQVAGDRGPEAVLGQAAVLVDAGRGGEAFTVLSRAARTWPLDERVRDALARLSAAAEHPP